MILIFKKGKTAMQKYIFTILLLLASSINARENLVATQKVQLTLESSLQKQVKTMTLEMKEKLRAKSISIAIMDSYTGELLSLTGSDCNTIKEFPKNSIASFTYEAGFVMAPFVFSLALEKHLITPYDLINGHQGHYQFQGRTIIDPHKFDYVSAANVIVYSSSIGMAQIAQKLTGKDYYNGLVSFCFAQQSIPDFTNENIGFIPNANQLTKAIYKATASYGYGVKVNLLQLLKAYNLFNNNGKLVIPHIVVKESYSESRKILSDKIVQDMRKILIETAERGTGIKTKIKGVEIGGKTGTAHVVESGKYVKKYNCSFVGFTNGVKHRYTIAVLVQQPKTSIYASKTAAVVFKKVVHILIQNSLLNYNTHRKDDK